jgi:uncharacterized protein (DUF488 family)
MDLFSDIQQRKAANAKKLASFGVASKVTDPGYTKLIRSGNNVTLYTVGYERRDGDGLISVLLDQGVKAIADIRERPTSRKPDFRAASLRALCKANRIEYQAWPMLGSTAEQRDELHASGDFHRFADRFRAWAIETMMPEIARLAESSRRIPTALLCYERLHEDCHRSVIAELVADQTEATIVAIQ